MASTVVNTVTGTPNIIRNRPVNLGNLTATASVVQFSLAPPHSTPNGNDLLTIVTAGGTVSGPVLLEFSLDGGTTWSTVAVNTQAATIALGGINGDTGTTTAGSFNVSGLQGALFRAGVTTVTTGPAAMWVLFG